MSDTYTWPQRCPDLVQDVSLKRARIDDENNTSAIRTTIAGVDADHPLPVLEKSDSAQWFIFGRQDSESRFFRVQWFYLSPQTLPYTISPITNIWFAIIKRNPTDIIEMHQRLAAPPEYRFTTFTSGSYFPGGWVASNFDYRNMTYTQLYAFKPGNTNFSSPDVKVQLNETFFWDGEDFMDCQQQFDSTTLYLQNTGGLPSDNAWSGAGDGTVISLLKGIANIF